MENEMRDVRAKLYPEELSVLESAIETGVWPQEMELRRLEAKQVLADARAQLKRARDMEDLGELLDQTGFE
jgi:uncharacterized protein YeaC (DUF1315 family)